MFYHDHCPDGFGAAFAFWKKYHNWIEYIPISHKKEKFLGIDRELFKREKIWMVDISLNRDDAIEANSLTKQFVILDHHITAIKNLNDLDFFKHDLEHSGAILAWNYCFPGEEAPKLLQYIEDRDLHRFKLPHSKEILAAIDAHYTKTFESWNLLNEIMNKSLTNLIADGSEILKYNQQIINSLKKYVYYDKIMGHLVPIVNTTLFRSDVVNELAKDQPFAAGYYYNGKDFIFSLRSDTSGLDVSEIASNFEGGGGHVHAAGFSVKQLSELNRSK